MRRRAVASRRGRSVDTVIDPEVSGLLRARRVEVDARLAHLAADERSLLRDRSDATADDEHDPEGSTLSGEWSRVDALRRAALQERAELERAEARVAQGTYGICAACERAIPIERLRARPMAERCVACAR
jgi:DnaK suppressor protein